jgi:S-(hydroxymethyl)mycothiol dehydrogenase
MQQVKAVVRIHACGVCHTDLHYREGGINDDFPFLRGEPWYCFAPFNATQKMTLEAAFERMHHGDVLRSVVIFE